MGDHLGDDQRAESHLFLSIQASGKTLAYGLGGAGAGGGGFAALTNLFSTYAWAVARGDIFWTSVVVCTCLGGGLAAYFGPKKNKLML